MQLKNTRIKIKKKLDSQYIKMVTTINAKGCLLHMVKDIPGLIK
jgi:hypothetical protein